MAVILFDLARYNKRLIEKLKPVNRLAHEGFAMTTHFLVIARRERSEGRGNPSCLRRMWTGLSLRLLAHSGSPRPQGARYDKGELRENADRLLDYSVSQRAFSHQEKKWGQLDILDQYQGKN